MQTFHERLPKALEDIRKRAARSWAIGELPKETFDHFCTVLDEAEELIFPITISEPEKKQNGNGHKK